MGNERLVPWHVHEDVSMRYERANRRLALLLGTTIILLFLTNALWLLAWNQYDYSSDMVTVDAKSGIANYIGQNGDITNGEDSSQETYSTAEKQE